jgi:hypothetical protein
MAMRVREGMDLRARAHYVACPMELLLTLFALLSAATGALTGARAPQAEVHQTIQAERPVVAAPRAVRMAQAVLVPTPAQPSAAAMPEPSRAPQVLAAAIPLYVDRLIE